MKLFPPPIVVAEDEGFTTENDIFERKPFADDLTNLLSVVEDPLVVAIDGPWGSGKTVFLKQWAGELRKVGAPVVYFDAFANDYQSDAFLALAAEVIAIAQQVNGGAKKTKVLGAAKAVGGFLLKTGINAGVKLTTGLTAEAVGASLQNAVEDAGKDAGSRIDKWMTDRLTKADEEKSAITNFAEALSTLPKDMGMPDKPLVIIVDELDRCRPTFAMELLERMKHFFAAPRVHFVLGVNLQQLGNTVRGLYGADTDASLYLEKFVSLKVDLPSQKNVSEVTDIHRFISHRRKAFDFSPDQDEFISNILTDLDVLAAHLEIEFRMLDRALSLVALWAANGSNIRNELRPLVCGLCLMKVSKPETYKRARDGRLQPVEASEFFRYVPLPNQGFGASHNDRILDHIHRCWIYFLGADDQEFQSYARGYENRKSVIPSLATKYLDQFKQYKTRK